MGATVTPKLSNYWVKERTWSEIDERIEQRIEHAAFGSPTDPADAGRLAVDAHQEDLKRLADS
jgi:hypothetical protein